MKISRLFLLLASSLFALTAVAQTKPPFEPQTTTEVPAIRIAQVAKPFLGDWQILSCAPNDGTVAIQARIEQGKPGIDKLDVAPQFFLTALYSPQGERNFAKPLQFITHAFLEFTATYNPSTLLEVTNGQLLLSLVPQKNGTLYGQVETQSGEQYDAFAIHSIGTVKAFYDKYIGLCTDSKAGDKFYGRVN